MSAEDSLAVSMLVILLIAGFTLMAIFRSLFRNAGKRDELAELMADQEPEKPGDAPGKKPSEPAGTDVAPREAWEQDADWWKS